MDRLIALGRLFDYYGVLLTERQRMFTDYYVNENMTLAEISEHEGVSRQAVRDAIVHSEEHLTMLEDNLHLAERTEKTRSAVKELTDLIGAVDIDERVKIMILEKIRNIGDLWEE